MKETHSYPVEFRTSLEDDPRVVEQQTKEDYTNHVVPKTARQSKGQIIGSWSSITSAMAFVSYGALAASIAGVVQAIIGLLLVVVAYSLLGRFSVAEAVRWGLNSTLISRRLFGVKGAAIVPLLVGISLFYYAVFEASIVAVALQAYFGVWDIRVWYGIVVLGMLPFMLGGIQTWLSKLNWVSLPIYFFGILGAVIVAASNVGWSGNWDAFDSAAEQSNVIPGWLAVFVLYMGIFVLFPETQDTARFAREADKTFHQNVTFGWVFYGIAFLFNGLAGIAIVGFSETGTEISESGVVQGVVNALGLFGLIVIIVSQVRINSANYYFASVNLERFIAHFTTKGISRRTWVFVLSVLVFLVMLTDVFSYISVALAWQAVLVVTLIAMMVTDRFMKSKETPEFRSARIKRFGAGFFVWIVSSGVGVVLLQMPNQLPTLSALAPLVSFALAVILYAFTQLTGMSSLKDVPSDAVREQIDDLWGTRVQCSECELSYVAIEMDTTDEQHRVLCLGCQNSVQTSELPSRKQ
ncbi:purine-cytosine permease-like protein [Glutamicibacter mysorens]|uniref:Purine-cytosine permease-like protein n=1 Tax=Glutamicibacter mysorens TaxID=257984 RepID=A0ABX4MUL6_9MICC|nr:hypothetical protein [Glutamicibacter mysorens]PJJ42940.1 purine-cytosine permease-like protein [Glutamicibacter mysorens]